MIDDKGLRTLIQSVLEELFSDVSIDSVSVDHDVDHDGDPILRVRVVFDARQNTLNTRQTSGLVRHLRPRLAEAGIEDFPIVSYIAKSEAGNQHADAI